MTARFIPYAGEAFAGEYVDYPCSDCGTIGCGCDDDYRADPQELSRWSKLTAQEREAEMQAIYAKIDAAFAAKVESDLRYTMDMQKRDAA